MGYGMGICPNPRNPSSKIDCKLYFMGMEADLKTNHIQYPSSLRGLAVQINAIKKRLYDCKDIESEYCRALIIVLNRLDDDFKIAASNLREIKIDIYL